MCPFSISPKKKDKKQVIVLYLKKEKHLDIIKKRCKKLIYVEEMNKSAYNK